MKMVFVKEENMSEPETCRIKQEEPEPEPCRIKQEEPEPEPETWRIKHEEQEPCRIKHEEQGGWSLFIFNDCLWYIRLSLWSEGVLGPWRSFDMPWTFVLFQYLKNILMTKV